MATQIDPLTGLPMVFDNIIEQIPLDAQIFPYADLGATARPTAPPLYPDSIIPVSAFLSGQHPDTGSAQTVETDGQHALLVKSVGGGGGTPVAVDWFNIAQTFTYTDTGFDIILGPWSNLTPDWKIVGAQASFSVDMSSGTEPTSGWAELAISWAPAPAAGNWMLLLGHIAYGPGGGNTGNAQWTDNFSPSVPLTVPHSNTIAQHQIYIQPRGSMPIRYQFQVSLAKMQ